jgi:two-component system, NtrC family, response regulator HydG
LPHYLPSSLIFGKSSPPEDETLLLKSLPQPRVPLTISVLVVDDDDQYRSALINNILELSGAEIDIEDASTGEETIAKIEKNRFDWIFLDLKLPGINGLETFARIREVNKTVGVVLMTSETKSDIARLAEANGHQVFDKLNLDLNIILFPPPGETFS